MIKIVMINGQNHRGSSYHIGRILIDGITGDKAVTEFFLPRDLNHFCLGCYTCIEDETRCPYYEEKHAIMQAVEAGDLLVFTTPNYCLAPSASLKAFIDLTFTYWFPHKPRGCLFDKKAVVISTTAGAGAGSAIKTVAKTLTYWGVPSITKYGIAVQAMNWQGVSDKKKAKITRDMNRLAKSLSQRTIPRVSLKTRFLFNMCGKMQKGNMGSGPAEKQYWEDQGWLGKERPWKTK